MEKQIKELLEFGIINMDKSSGPTSFNVSEFVKKKLNLRKTSHFGTLDPKVTGVLPVALNRACKLTGYFLGEDKTYVGIMRMHEDISMKKVQEKINEKFTGKIIQMPPLKSRVKRQLRPRTIHKFKLLEKDSKDFLFEVKCEGGTYIRALCNDLGQELGCGAHMLELRRTNAGIFGECGTPQAYSDKSSQKISTGSINLYDFEKAVDEYEKGNEDLLRKIIIPAEDAIKKVFPVVKIKKRNLKRIFTGKPIHEEDLVRKSDFDKDSIVSIFCDKRFVGMYKIIGGEDVFAKAEFVMQPIKG